MLEHEVETYLYKQCKKNNILCWKFISPTQNGIPDRILIAQNIIAFVELKRPGKKPRKLQKAVIKLLKSYGCNVYTIDTKQKVDTLIKRLITQNHNKKGDIC